MLQRPLDAIAPSPTQAEGSFDGLLLISIQSQKIVRYMAVGQNMSKPKVPFWDSYHPIVLF